MLPLSLSWALIVGIGTSLSHIIIISTYVPVTSPETPDLAVQVKPSIFELMFWKMGNNPGEYSLLVPAIKLQMQMWE